MPRKTARSEKPRYRLYTVKGPDGLEHFYGDFRKLGGTRRALIPHGETRGTIDRDVAEKIAAQHAAELVEHKHKRQRIAAGVEQRPAPRLKAYAAHHLREKAKAGSVTEKWLKKVEGNLAFVISYLGANTELTAIGVTEIQNFLYLAKQRQGLRGNTTLSNGTLRHYMNALSNLYRRAQAEQVVPPGYNPVAAVLEKPSTHREEARWLEVHEAALLLEAARTHAIPDHIEHGFRSIHALLATFVLTGGRKNEVLGLQVGDINFERKTITFRRNAHRRLKTKNSFRVVPLWPQLEEILRAHLRTEQLAGGLLFQPRTKTRDGMIVDFRKQLDTIGERAGWATGEIRTKMFRHTYCAARLQTVDRGAPVSTFTVARELGHGGLALVNSVYGHLGSIRHRSDVVEYRPGIIDTIEDAETKRRFTDRLSEVRRTA